MSPPITTVNAMGWGVKMYTFLSDIYKSYTFQIVTVAKWSGESI
jgi:hypothetical protein